MVDITTLLNHVTLYCNVSIFLYIFKIFKILNPLHKYQLSLNNFKEYIFFVINFFSLMIIDHLIHCIYMVNFSLCFTFHGPLYIGYFFNLCDPNNYIVIV